MELMDRTILHLCCKRQAMKTTDAKQYGSNYFFHIYEFSCHKIDIRDFAISLASQAFSTSVDAAYYLMKLTEILNISTKILVMKGREVEVMCEKIGYYFTVYYETALS